MNDKRERILRAAAGEIVENGLQFQMSAIAVRAEIATGSVYNYFPSKQALIEGVFADVSGAMASAVIIEHPEGTSPEVKIRRYISDYMAFVVADAQRIALFEYLDNSPALNLQHLAVIFAPMLHYTRSLIEEAQQAGVICGGPPYLLGSFVRGAIRHSIRRRKMIDKSEIPASELEWIGQLCWNALVK